MNQPRWGQPSLAASKPGFQPGGKMSPSLAGMMPASTGTAAGGSAPSLPGSRAYE